MKLGWMVFFSCMLATFTADLFNSALVSFQYKGTFGLFDTDKYIIFKVWKNKYFLLIFVYIS